MPGMNVRLDDNELAAITAAAQARGISVNQYIREAALDRALAKQTAFLDAAMDAYDFTKDAFAELYPEDAQPNHALRQAETDAARRLAELDRPAHGNAA